VIKGDDVETDALCTPVINFPEPELSNSYIVLKVDRNLPPYHAGRFFTPTTIVPDVIRRTIKLMARTTTDPNVAAEWIQGFRADYVRLTNEDHQYLSIVAPEMYSDFDPGFVRAVLEMYVQFQRDEFIRTVILEGPRSEADILLTFDLETDCAEFAFMCFGVVADVRDRTMEEVMAVGTDIGIPVFKVSGKKSDFKKRGLWFSAEHVWAVIGMTEVTNQLSDIQDQDVSREVFERYRNILDAERVSFLQYSAVGSRRMGEEHEEILFFGLAEGGRGRGDPRRLVRGSRQRFLWAGAELKGNGGRSRDVRGDSQQGSSKDKPSVGDADAGDEESQVGLQHLRV